MFHPSAFGGPGPRRRGPAGRARFDAATGPTASRSGRALPVITARGRQPAQTLPPRHMRGPPGQQLQSHCQGGTPARPGPTQSHGDGPRRQPGGAPGRRCPSVTTHESDVGRWNRLPDTRFTVIGLPHRPPPSPRRRARARPGPGPAARTRRRPMRRPNHSESCIRQPIPAAHVGLVSRDRGTTAAGRPPRLSPWAVTV